MPNRTINRHFVQTASIVPFKRGLGHVPRGVWSGRSLDLRFRDANGGYSLRFNYATPRRAVSWEGGAA
jgi:hypothetical protein